MATLISAATGNLTAAGTWKKIAPAGLLESSGGSTALSTTPLSSATFVLGATAVDAVAIKLASVTSAAQSSGGTITLTLRNNTTATDILSTTIGLADLPICDTTDINGGWILFSFGSTHTPNGTDSYLIKLVRSVATGAVSLYTNGTANNWARMVRETTTQAPVAGDNLIIAGEHTGNGTGNNFTVTMDETATTDYGSATASDHVDAIHVSKRGTLTWGTAAATNYRLKYSGNFVVCSGGTHNMGTTGTPCPRDSTMIIEADPASDGQFGSTCRTGGTWNMQGQSRTAGKNVVMCKLSADAAATATSLSVDTDTGWKSGDEIGIASTSTTQSQFEKRTLNGDAGASSLSVTAGLTNAHSGTTDLQAEIVLLTHHVKFRSATSTLMTYFRAQKGAAVDIDWTEFQYCGTQFTPVGIGIETTVAAGGSCALRYFCVKDTEGSPLTTAGTDHDTWSVRDGVFYNVATLQNTLGVSITATTGTGWTLSDIIVIGGGNSGATAFQLADLAGTISNLYCNSWSGAGVNLVDAVARGWAISGIYAHSINGATSAGILATTDKVQEGTISNFALWRNIYGVYLSATNIDNITFSTGRIYGNTTAGVRQYPGGALTFNLIWKSVHFNGTSISSQPAGVEINTNSGYGVAIGWRFENCTFGVVSGAFTAHGFRDIYLPSTNLFTTITLLNCILATSTEVDITSTPTGLIKGSFVASQQHDQTVNHKMWVREGRLAYETTTVDVSPSLKMTPLTASYKIESNGSLRARGFLVRVASGATKTPSVKVRKDSSYNGNAPRLILKSNPAIGINSDAVLDTLSVGADTWETLTGTTAAASADGVFEFVVDCDGTAGNVFVDTWSA